jgi:hypothetical protein
VKSFNPFYDRKHHTRDHFCRTLRVFNFRHGAAGKILTPIMQAAFNHPMRQSSASRRRQLWRSLLLVLRNTPLSGGAEAVLVPARVKITGRAPRMLNELAGLRD